ncbi:GntR family transcriptional regulator [Nocardiopsis sp. NPDC055879]
MQYSYSTLGVSALLEVDEILSVLDMDWKEGLSRWVQITDELERRIEAGEYEPGDRVPSVLSIMQEFQVASATAQKSLVGLRDRGLIKTYPGMGSYVKQRGS